MILLCKYSNKHQ